MVAVNGSWLGLCSTAALLAVSTTLAQAPVDFSTVQARAYAAMGSAGLGRLEFAGSGWEACLGQPWRIDQGWARWELSNYRRVLDYGQGLSLHNATRRAGLDPDRLGGCGAQPDAAAGPSQSSLSPASSWENQLPLWLTPQGFLQLAQANSPRVEAADGGWDVSFTTEQGGVVYPFSGHLDVAYLPKRIVTRIDNSVFGDMLVEAEFTDYRDFSGLQFPASLMLKQGGFPILNLQITDVVPNTQAEAAPPLRQGGGGGGGAPQAPGEALTEVAPGIYVSNGAYQSVIVEMERSLVVIDGLQNDARSAEIIAQARAAFPNKKIGYVISTHNHFDHASGLRAFATEGATLITHKTNEAFFSQVLAVPRSLHTGAPEEIPMTVLGVGDFFALSDSVNRIELYKLNDGLHADDMLIAYLPAIQTVVEADLLQPWINPVFGGGRDGPHPFLVYLAYELDRLGLAYERFIPIHRPPQPPFMPREDLMTAVGRVQ